MSGTTHAKAAGRPLPPLTISAWLRWDLIEPELRSIPRGVVLEIGPGEGAAAVRIAQLHSYVGLESSQRTSAITAARLADLGLDGRVVCSFEELDEAELFDAVCAFEVLEHIEDDRDALRTWIRLLRPGGMLVLSVPAGSKRMGAADRFVGHFRRYDADHMAELLRSSGLEDIRVIHTGFGLGHAAEAVRNALAARRLANSGAAGQDRSIKEATEGSSSFLQPPQWAGTATRAASWPGRMLQRMMPSRGTGLFAVARAPTAGASADPAP